MLLDTPICDFDRPMPDFMLRDPDGAAYRRDELMGTKGLLVAFICNHCPYVKAIAHRLAEDTRTLMSEGIGVVAIMPNDYTLKPADSPAEMKTFATAHGFAFPYLVDEDQSVARAFDAVCTPDFFGYNTDYGLQYRGRLDDKKMQDDPDGRVLELVDAMRQIATTGCGPEAQHPSMGCSIKWRA